MPVPDSGCVSAEEKTTGTTMNVRMVGSFPNRIGEFSGATSMSKRK
jgi:hypothetical protein